MTKTCEIDRTGADLPCGRRAKHTLKIIKSGLGQHGKTKIPICDEHYKILEEQNTLADILDSKRNPDRSMKYTAVLIRGRV